MTESSRLLSLDDNDEDLAWYHIVSLAFQDTYTSRISNHNTTVNNNSKYAYASDAHINSLWSQIVHSKGLDRDKDAVITSDDAPGPSATRVFLTKTRNVTILTSNATRATAPSTIPNTHYEEDGSDAIAVTEQENMDVYYSSTGNGITGGIHIQKRRRGRPVGSRSKVQPAAVRNSRRILGEISYMSDKQWADTDIVASVAGSDTGNDNNGSRSIASAATSDEIVRRRRRTTGPSSYRWRDLRASVEGRRRDGRDIIAAAEAMVHNNTGGGGNGDGEQSAEIHDYDLSSIDGDEPHSNTSVNENTDIHSPHTPVTIQRTPRKVQPKRRESNKASPIASTDMQFYYQYTKPVNRPSSSSSTTTANIPENRRSIFRIRLVIKRPLTADKLVGLCTRARVRRRQLLSRKGIAVRPLTSSAADAPTAFDGRQVVKLRSKVFLNRNLRMMKERKKGRMFGSLSGSWDEVVGETSSRGRNGRKRKRQTI